MFQVQIVPIVMTDSINLMIIQTPQAVTPAAQLILIVQIVTNKQAIVSLAKANGCRIQQQKAVKRQPAQTGHTGTATPALIAPPLAPPAAAAPQVVIAV